MKIFLKSYDELFEDEQQSEDIGQPRFDEYPESLKNDIESFVKFFNKNVLQQVKSKVNNISFEKREGDTTFIRSTDIISSQLGLIALVTDKATILIKLQMDDVKKEAKGTLYLCFLEQELAISNLWLKDGQMMYASSPEGDYVVIDESEFAIGVSGTHIS